MIEGSAATSFVRIGPERVASPVVLSVPHAGRDYRPALLKAARLPRHMLETLEDRLVDRLIWRATAAGATALIATAPRAEIDLNRDEREIDPLLVAPPLPPGRFVQSVRTRGGIGLIPSRINGAGAIWIERIAREELDRRIRDIHRPYHEALERVLGEARERYGAAVLLDCHSMPPRTAAERNRRGMVVFGDRHGTSAAAELLDAAVATAQSLGYQTACNTPYAGGYVSRRHGRPEKGVHAIQIEIDRSAYLDTELRQPGPGFDSACSLLAAIVDAIEARLTESDQAIAAE